MRVKNTRMRGALALAGIALVGAVAAVAVADAMAFPVDPAVIGDPAAEKPAVTRDGPKPRAKNVIVMISDGMGYNQLAASDYYQAGKLGAQPYERFGVRLAMSTYSYYSAYDASLAWGTFEWVKSGATDSAAAATAMSTGVKTYDAAIGVDVNGARLYHVAERAEALGKSTGVVTTVEWSHATPAGFVAHNPSRNDYAGIGAEMINDSATDVIMGAGHPMFDDSGVALATAKSYKYVGGETTWNALLAGTAGGDADGDGDADPFALIQTRDEFKALAKATRTPARVCGTAQVHTTLQQGRAGDTMADPFVVPLTTSVPTLKQMTKGALNVLDDNKKGFFLMVEGGAVDWACHANQPGRLIEEQIDFDKAVKAVIKWVNKNSDWNETLLIVTGDHETGLLWGPGSGVNAEGVAVWNPIVNNGEGKLPGMQFNSGDHTNSLIPFFARGATSRQLRIAATGADPVRGAYLDNTDIAKAIFSAMR